MTALAVIVFVVDLMLALAIAVGVVGLSLCSNRTGLPLAMAVGCTALIALVFVASPPCGRGSEKGASHGGRTGLDQRRCSRAAPAMAAVPLGALLLAVPWSVDPASAAPAAAAVLFWAFDPPVEVLERVSSCATGLLAGRY